MATATFRIWRGEKGQESSRTIRPKSRPAWWSLTPFIKSRRNRPAILPSVGIARRGNAVRVPPKSTECRN